MKNQVVVGCGFGYGDDYGKQCNGIGGKLYWLFKG